MESKRYNKEFVQLGGNVRRIRMTKRLALLDLEAAPRIGHGDISRIENGRMDIQFNSIVKLAQGLKVSTPELFAY
jgi:transcriptional regulator with XRE-family HTH domain